ncbi:MAG: hypothetical protein ACPG7F_02530 [Aggregatilineales bacterium]
MYDVHWLIAEKLVLIQLSGHIRKADLTQLNKQLTHLLDNTSQSDLHFVIKTSNIQTYPEHIFALRQTLNCFQHQKMGWTLMTGEDKHLMMLFSMMVNLAGARFQYTRTEAKTWRFLYYMDSTLRIPFSLAYGNSQCAINQDRMLFTPLSNDVSDSTFAR